MLIHQRFTEIFSSHIPLQPSCLHSLLFASLMLTLSKGPYSPLFRLSSNHKRKSHPASLRFEEPIMTFHPIVCGTSKIRLKLAAPSHVDLLQTLTDSIEKILRVQGHLSIFQLILQPRMEQIKKLLYVQLENLPYNQQDLLQKKLGM